MDQVCRSRFCVVAADVPQLQLVSSFQLVSSYTVHRLLCQRLQLVFLLVGRRSYYFGRPNRSHGLSTSPTRPCGLQTVYLNAAHSPCH